ncbi:SdiA-regulated domain-containing protein [bacterium SCSIO 12741]|nr:SdiA-regulated domain-containing protein [bacterium SCSIO 12741]
MKNNNSYSIANWALFLVWFPAILMGACSTPAPAENEEEKVKHDTVYLDTNKVVKEPTTPPPPPPRETTRAEKYYLITDSAKYIYDLYTYDVKIRLPYVLETVSGLTWIGDNHVAMVEDEGGKVYEYDLQKKKITHSVAFSAPGDFEGIAWTGEHYYAVKSNGDLYRLPKTEESRVKPKKTETPLSSRNNIEGICYDGDKNRLLIITKQTGDLKKQKVKGKAVFAFNLKKEKFKQKPVLTINQDKLLEFFTTHRDLVYDPGRVKIKPSGIAIHPLSGHFYVLASTGKIMVEMDRKGEVVATYPISPNLLIQPEGICFAPNGDLYIASEGQGERGYILKFKVKEK